jgi:glycosyltransferase involved in cell wall biosynthesis
MYMNSSVIPLGALAALWLGKPHVWHLREFGDLDYNLTPDWGKTFADFVLNKADAKICVSEALHAHYSQGLVNDTFHVVYNGVATKADMESFHHTAATRASDDNVFVFALVGIILPGKWQETAIMALALLKESMNKAHLIIAGGGEGTKQLEELAARCGVADRITFRGYAKLLMPTFSPMRC